MQSFEDMYNLLVEQKQVLEELLALSREKGRVIIGGDTARLDEIVSRERKLIREITAIDKRREELAPVIAGSLGIPAAGLTVTAIAEHMSPEKREPFLAVRRELLSLVRMQAELNESNKELIRTQLEYTDAIMELLVQSEDPLNNFYGDDGKEQTDKKKTPGLFDTQI